MENQPTAEEKLLKLKITLLEEIAYIKRSIHSSIINKAQNLQKEIKESIQVDKRENEESVVMIPEKLFWNCMTFLEKEIENPEKISTYVDREIEEIKIKEEILKTKLLIKT